MTNRIFSQVVADASFRLTECLNNLPADTKPYALSLIRGAIQDLDELRERGVGTDPVPVNTDILADLNECLKLMNSVLMSSVNGMIFRQHNAGKTLWAALDKLNMVRLQVERESISDLKTKSPSIDTGGEDLYKRLHTLKFFFGDWRDRMERTIGGSLQAAKVHPEVSIKQLAGFRQTIEEAIRGIGSPFKQGVSYPTDWAGVDEMQRSVLALKAFVSEWNLKQQKNKDGSAPYLSPTQLSQFEHTLDQVIDGWEPGPSEVDQTMAIVDDEQLRGEIQHYKRYFEGWETTPNDSFPHPPVPFTKTMHTRLVQLFDEVLNGKLRMRAATQEQTEPTLVLHEMEIWEVQQDPKFGTVLVQEALKRAGVDPETDTFPLSIEAISYSRLFEEHLANFQTANCQCMLANRDRIHQESLKRWHECMTALSTLHGLTNADEIYRDWLKFLEEVKQASGRMQEILVQDIPVFKPA